MDTDRPTTIDELIKASTRLDTVLETIKYDLIQLRNQDIKLMKQLIQISDTIQQITKRHIRQEPSYTANGYLRQVLMFVQPTSISLRVETPLIRRQSVPVYCRMKKNGSGSISSTEEASSSSSYTEDPLLNLSEDQQSDGQVNSIQRQLSQPVSWNRPKSVSYVTSGDLNDSDKYLEDVLLRNVKMWKRTQQIDSDSVFLEDDFLTN